MLALLLTLDLNLLTCLSTVATRVTVCWLFLIRATFLRHLGILAPPLCRVVLLLPIRLVLRSQCPDCSAVFPDLRMIRVHQASHHKVTVEQRNLGVSFDPLQHARAGMPICALCDKVFSRWSVLRDHIQKGRCAFLDTTLVPCDSALYSIA